MGRSIPWRNRCPPEVTSLLGRVSTCGLLVVQQPGPTSFVLKDPQTNKKVKVSIGEEHQCNCRQASPELCLHVVFVLSRVFRLPHDNPLVWQRSLLAAEVDQLIRGHTFTQAKKRRGQDEGPSDGKTMVPRRPPQPEDVCPICCDDITEDRALVYCRYGCGNCIHAACFKQYATHNSTSPTPLTCPLCREPWGLLGDGPSHNLQCSDCKGPILGERYKCAFCATYNLCGNCFECPMIHAQHPFDVAIGPGMPFQPANRPVPQRTTRSAPIPLPATDVIHPWMMRELGPEDYEALLQLDESVAPAASVTLLPGQAESLRRHSWDPTNEAMASCDTCAICMEPFRRGEEVNSLPLCSHYFHVPCAFRWLTECRGVCPIDNVPVPAASFVRNPTSVPASTTDSVAPGGLTQVTSRPIRPPRRAMPTLEPGGAPRSGNAGGSGASSSLRPRHRFEDARADQREELSRRNPNASLSGYCPTQADLSLLVVGSTSSSSGGGGGPVTNGLPVMMNVRAVGRGGGGGVGVPMRSSRR